MLMPILRLVLIYLVLVAAVVAVFNRDKLAALLPGARGGAAEIAAPADTGTAPDAPTSEPRTEDAPTQQDTEEHQRGTASVYPDPAVVGGEPAAALTAPQPPAPGTPAPLGTPVADPVAATPPQAATPDASDAPPQNTTDALAAGIADARAAYWSGDIAGARSRMLALSESNPDNPDIAGELGNLAFALGDYPAAAEAWARAGGLLIDRGEGGRVMTFLPILQSIAPDKAAALAARLQDR